MEMDTWYDLRIQQFFDVTGRVNELLDEVKDTGEGVAPAPGPRVREPFGGNDRVSDLLKEGHATSEPVAPPARTAVPSH